jgi:hypothetical protein
MSAPSLARVAALVRSGRDAADIAVRLFVGYRRAALLIEEARAAGMLAAACPPPRTGEARDA